MVIACDEIEEEAQPLMLGLREKVQGVVIPDSNSGEHPTFIGATQGQGADYETD